MEYVFLGLNIGSFVILIIILLKRSASSNTRNAVAELKEAQRRNELLMQEKTTLIAQKEEADKLIAKFEDETKALRTQKEKLIAEFNTLKANNENLLQDLNDQKEEFKEMQKELRIAFENTANKVLKQNTEDLSDANKEKLETILKPFKENLESFKRKVEETHKDELEARGSLKQELKQLMHLNNKMSEEAKNLTKALKGETKTQGNWGEIILERILERSGLTKGREYEVQSSSTNDEGKRLQPDVVIHLPDEKFLIVDAKVTLTAFERYSSAVDEAEVKQALEQHLTAIQAHVKGLSSKNYQQIHGPKSPDFVLLFIPIEPAFALALQHDQNLYYEAFEKNIVIVSPSTLLATLSTINSVWKQEYQNKNAIEIAERGGALYDKFVGFIESMEDIGQRISQTEKSYSQALSRLSTGNGSLVRQAQMLKELGAKATKKLPSQLRDSE